MTITFCGATQRVTGSNFLVETMSAKFLVDCGLFQGDKDDDRQNWEDFPYDPKQIDFVIITHSHIDHIGRLPLLYKKGFRGKIYATPPTLEFCRIFLEDSCHILKNTAEHLDKQELYNIDDVHGVLKLFEACDYYKEFSPIISHPEVKPKDQAKRNNTTFSLDSSPDGHRGQNDICIKFHDAGHILGSAIVQIKADNKTVVFSGDLGNPPVPILRNTDFIPEADYVIMESTYGDREHEPFAQRKLELERTIEDVVTRKGVLLVPAFAMERTQEILYELNELVEHSRIPKIPIYIDSPLAIKATAIYKTFPQYFDDEAQKLIKDGKDFFQFPGLQFIQSKEESKQLDQDYDSKIIIAGSGMSTGGRILFHEKKYLPLESTILLTVGFQVKGTLGRTLLNQSKLHPAGGGNMVKILKEQIPVRAEIRDIESYSAHADQKRLKYWLSKIKGIKQVFLVHGEKPAMESLLHKIEEEQGIDVEIPKYKEKITL